MLLRMGRAIVQHLQSRKSRPRGNSRAHLSYRRFEAQCASGPWTHGAPRILNSSLRAPAGRREELRMPLVAPIPARLRLPAVLSILACAGFANAPGRAADAPPPKAAQQKQEFTLDVQH